MIVVLLAGFAACLNQAYGIGDAPGGAGDGRSGTASEGAPNGSDPGAGPDGTGSDGGEPAAPDSPGSDPDGSGPDGSGPDGSDPGGGSDPGPGSSSGPAAPPGDGSTPGAPSTSGSPGGPGTGPPGTGPGNGTGNGTGTTPGGMPGTGPVPAGPACADADVEIQPGLDRLTYTVGEQPVMTLTVRNVSGRPCVREVGADQQELRLTAGKARLWSSDDCRPAQGAERRAIGVGETLLYRFTWSGTTSEPGCRTARTLVGPGTYQLQARLGSKLSAPLTFRIV